MDPPPLSSAHLLLRHPYSPYKPDDKFKCRESLLDKTQRNDIVRGACPGGLHRKAHVGSRQPA